MSTHNRRIATQTLRVVTHLDNLWGGEPEPMPDSEPLRLAPRGSDETPDEFYKPRRQDLSSVRKHQQEANEQHRRTGRGQQADSCTVGA